MSMTRRLFVKSGALALVALGAPPGFVTRSLFARARRRLGGKSLVCVFQRGAVDGLNMVVPFGDPAYARARRSIAVAAPARASGSAAIDLDGYFGLHPALEPLADLYRRGDLAALHAVGSPHPTRSHFEAQDYMETAVPGDKSVADGWLNRALVASSPDGCAACRGRTLADGRAHAADHATGQRALGTATLRGVALAPALPKALRGSHPALAIPGLEDLGLPGGSEGAFARLWRAEEGDVVAGAADEAFEALARLREADPGRYRSAPGVAYPRGRFGESLRQVAQLVKSDVGVEMAFVDIGGWDTHVAQGGAEGQLANRLSELGRGLRALHDDLGDRMEDVVVLTMSEFGRTVAENGSGGTDHGHATCMLAMGGSVRGGRVVGRWPGLGREALYEGRDLAVTTDFRDLFAEVAERHLGVAEVDRIFPGYRVDPDRYPGVVT